MNKGFLTVLFFTFSLVSIGQVIIKNSGTSNLNVAYCYYDNSTGWTTKGWYIVEAKTEKPIYNFTQFNNPNFYYCATIEDCDRGYFGDFPLFVNRKTAFTIPNADKNLEYTNPLIDKINFRQVNLKGKTTFTIELTPQNLTCYGQKQGKWTLLIDRDGDYAEKKEDAVYFREITFDKGRPIGWCKDYYSDGKVKAEFKLLNENPVTYDGRCIWYNQDGTVQKEVSYKNGTPVKETAYGSSGATETKEVQYEAVELPVQNFFINSTSNETWKGGKSKTVYPVSLPENTVEWYYEFTASRDEAEMKSNAKQFSLASQLTSLVDKTGILKTSVNMFTAPPGANNCNVYLIDRNEYNNFLSSESFKYYTIGTRTNYKSGIVQVRGLSSISNPMIAIKNPDGYYGIHVSVQVVAIVSKLE